MNLIAEQPPSLQFPLRVPVVVTYGSAALHAQVLGASAQVMLLQGPDRPQLPPLGTPLRLKVAWDRQQLTGRMAAHGVKSRFLVALGERAIRGTRRHPVDLPVVVRSPQFAGPESARIVDLSTSGARVEGPAARLPIGAEVELRFTPPGQAEPMALHGFVIRKIPGTQAVGVAFRLASPVLELLERPAD